MKFFSYGIFITPDRRASIGITAPARYATVEGYATIGDYIVQAVPLEHAVLTGIIVDVPDDVWPQLDLIEGGYDRISVTTTRGEEAQMYVAKTYKPKEGKHNANKRK